MIMGYPERHYVASTILTKPKYVKRLEENKHNYLEAGGFQKVARGYAIAMCQKKGFKFDPEDIMMITSEIFDRVYFGF